MAGRPSPIDAVIGTRTVDGQEIPVTVADRIVAALRAGVFLYEAADAAGVGRETVKGWIRAAGKLLIQHRGDIDSAPLTAHERRCIAFSAAVEEARAVWLVDANTTHERLARGGLPQVVETVETDDAGAVVKTSVRTTHTLPDARVIEWRLKHIRPDLYSERIEVSGPGGGPIELSTEERASALLVLAQGFREPPVEVASELVKVEPTKRRRRTPPRPERAMVAGPREEGTDNDSDPA